MFDRLRETIGSGLGALANRMTREPRHAEESRVPHNGRSLAGVVVTPDTALAVPAVLACVRYLAQTSAGLPWSVYHQTETGNAPAPNHKTNWLIHKKPNPEWSSFQFRETLVSWALRWGNGYAEIQRNDARQAVALWPIHPERVGVCRAKEPGEDAYGDPIAVGDLFYEVSNFSGEGEKTILASRNMFHIRGMGEGPVGLNIIDYAGQSIGWARAAQLFGASFFGNGMTPSGVVVNKKPLKPDGLKRQKAEFEALYKGPRNANKTAFLDNDADWKPMGFNAREAQLVEVHQHLVEEVCRIFGVPPHKVMHLLRSTFNNIEHQSIEVVVDSITPWVKRFEDEADDKLFGAERFRGFYTKMNMNALLRGDMKARMEFYKGMVFVGAMSPNEIRTLEEMNRLGTEGDIHVMQEQMATLSFISEKKQPVTASPSAPNEADQADDDLVEDDDATEARGRFAEILQEA